MKLKRGDKVWFRSRDGARGYFRVARDFRLTFLVGHDDTELKGTRRWTVEELARDARFLKHKPRSRA